MGAAAPESTAIHPVVAQRPDAAAGCGQRDPPRGRGGLSGAHLFRSPFYLKLLLAQAGVDGAVLRGRAALFTGFVRQALGREIDADNPAFRPGFLLDRRDRERILRREWRHAMDLPSRGPLLPALCRLAFGPQARRAPGEASRVRVPFDDAMGMLAGGLGSDRAEDLLHAGVALQVLEVQWDDVLYVHQLLQEYFAARTLGAAPQPDVAVSVGLRQRLQEVLVARSRDPEADLRARIAAARALGELGDPRLERRSGPHGDYLLTVAGLSQRCFWVSAGVCLPNPLGRPSPEH
jgi:hypothetical protein